MIWKHLLAASLALLAGTSARGQVVINEILYNSPGDFDALQFVEVLNTGAEAVPLDHWSFSKGIEFRFPTNLVLQPAGMAVVCSDAGLFREVYGRPPTGQFHGRLRKRGESIELVNAGGVRVDTVEFGDSAPWPLAPDGFSSSLERICPTASGADPENWAGSPLSPNSARPGGTPFRRNHSHSSQPPPRLVLSTPLSASVRSGQTLRVECMASDDDGIGSVTLVSRLAGSGEPGQDRRTPMTETAPGRYSVELPVGDAGGRILRLFIEAADKRGATRRLPASSEPRPTFSVWVEGEAAKTAIRSAHLIQTSPQEVERLRQGRLQGGRQQGFGRAGAGQETARARTERLVRTGLDFTYIWTRLALRQEVAGDRLLKLKPLFLERIGGLTDEVNEVAGSTAARNNDLLRAEMIRRRRIFIDALKPALDEKNRSSLEAWWVEEGENHNLRGSRPSQNSPVRRFWDLERGYASLTLREPTTAAEMEQWRIWVLENMRERDALAPLAIAAMEDEAAMEPLEQQLEPIRKRLRDQIAMAAGEAALEAFESGMAPRIPSGSGPPREPIQGTAVLVITEPGSGAVRVFDYITLGPRVAGYKVHLQKDRPFDGMTTLNLIFEYNERFVIAEPLAYKLYRQVGMAAPRTDFFRLHVDGEAVGYHLMVEQPNKAFLKKAGLKDDGNLYKLLWYGRGLVGQHEKKTRLQTGHEDLQELVRLLQNTQGDAALWEVIQKHFDVDQVINYFAVNACLSHWDGFFNNYFTYHDVSGTGKWTLYPWDQDKTWGFHDGVGSDEIFHDMPLTFGMEGDKRPPARGLAGWFAPQGFGGFHVWWRPGGWFSRPLLANPSFRGRYLGRLKQILEKDYTLERWEPTFRSMEEKLIPEARERARIINESEAEAVSRLKLNMNLMRKHLTQRRKFLLEQPELKAAAVPPAR